MKKLFIALAAAFLFVFSVIPVFASHQFLDVGDSHVYHEVLDFLKDRSVIAGYSDGKFKPDNPVKRVEALKILFEGANLIIPEVSSKEDADFSDVIPGQWYMKYIVEAKARGIVVGYNDGTFRPINTIKLAEALKILFLTYNITVPNLPTNADLPSDVKATDWFAKYIHYALQKGIIEEVNSLVGPGVELSRGRFANLVFRLSFLRERVVQKFTEADWATYEAKEVYKALQAKGTNFSNGLCIANNFIPNWVADIAHNPREAVDEDSANQCSAFRLEQVENFIELDVNGNVLSIFYDGEYLISPSVSSQKTWSNFIEGSRFTAPTLTITKGDAVKFINQDITSHQVATDPHPLHTQLPGFISPVLAPGANYEFVFANTGTFTYHCHLHPSMTGTIIVTD